MAEVGPVNSTQNFQKFGAIWSKFREVACLQLMHGPSPECPLLARSNQDHFGGSWCPWAAAAVDGVWRPGERRQRRPRASQDREGPDGASW